MGRADYRTVRCVVVAAEMKRVTVRVPAGAIITEELADAIEALGAEIEYLDDEPHIIRSEN